MKKLGLSLLSLAALIGVTGCGPVDPPIGPVEYEYGEDEMYEKLWETKVVHNEICLMIEQDDGSFSSRLVYKPETIISVRNFNLETEYSTSDYKIEGDRIIATSNAMPRLTKKNMSCEEVPEVIGGTYDDGKGGKILFTEGPGIYYFYINVTYTHKDSWYGRTPQRKGDLLPKLQRKLANQEPINFVCNGDSIFTGCHASSQFQIEPNLDIFPVGFASEMKRKYGSEVTLTNTSVGGMLSDWGKANVVANVNQYNPDLVLIGFGMNDGSWLIPTSDYLDNIEFMVQSIKNSCPNAEIIVAATILANPDSAQNKGQANYLPALLTLEEGYSGVAVLDMTSYSQDLLEKKEGIELYANNINHPNDMIVRGYVANLMHLIEVDE